ncbi:hypothetical protein C5S31_07075 [ANME-1 cluster archaeon GoMg2]|nr:hypothetical protein [ANME-1 cluster archaeon GoMg2]
MESDKRIKIEGEGHLINKDSSKRFPVKFEVEQIQTGKISGKCTLSGFEYEDILSPSQLKKCRIISGNLIKTNDKMYEFILEYFRNFSLEGETDNRDNVIVKNIFTYSIKYSSSRPRTLNLEFSAREVEVVYETISSKDQLWIEYGIINLNLTLLLRGHIETDIGKITFLKWKDHDETIKKMETFKTPLISGLLNITDVNIGNFESFDSYLEISNATIEKVLELLSLAQSTYLSYCSICIYAKTPTPNSQDDYKLKRMTMLNIKKKTPSLGQPLISDWEDIYNFISPKTIQKYSDLRDKCDLNIALEWYLESLSHGVLQSDYLLACTCLELLKDRYNKKIDNEYIINQKEFDDKKYKHDFKKAIKNVLKVKGANKEIRAEIYANLEGINRTSFKNSLLRLLEDHRIIYNDLFTDIKEITKIRDQITHMGIQEIPPIELNDVNQRLICLIQRIFLALLKYKGSFLDRNDGYTQRKFTDFISGGQHARTAEEISRCENGAR